VTDREAAPPLATSRAVTTVFEELLSAVHRGELKPGQRISDAGLAAQYGVSRTPVREALQRLRELGIIEASPSRFTRVADVTPAQTVEALVVWLALYGALLEEVIPRGVTDAVPELTVHHAAFLQALRAMDPNDIATTNFLFFSVLPQRSTNRTLQRSILGVVHIVRLGSLHLPDYIDFTALGRAQELVIDAARAGDLTSGREAMRVIGSIDVPVG
jgi:DNA-binding GntR family transcriptional regulator